MIRAFLAAELPQNVVQYIENTALQLRFPGNDIKWVNPKSIHLTLKFLGHIEEKLIEPIVSIASEIVGGQKPLELEAGQVGAFPNPRNPRVIWVGISGETERLCIVQRQIEVAFSALGFAEEKRPFRPHLTLGRIRPGKKVQNLESRIHDMEKVCSGPFFVTEIILYQSVLRPEGAVYTSLHRLPFLPFKTDLSE